MLATDSSPFSTELTPVTTLPILEVRRKAEFTAALDDVVASRLPSFIVRAAGFADLREVGNAYLYDTVAAHLRARHFNVQDGTQLPRLEPNKEPGKGTLHTDNRSVGAVDAISIHTTTAGAGEVLIAESGPDVVKVLYQRRGAYARILNRSLIEESETDPLIIRPVLYTADLDTGDHVIFASFNLRGPIWHRFDTTTVPRTTDVFEVEFS
ncbi:MAG: hypothetical protein WA843_03145 [Candidatus Saccharimonadales bacterium]